MKKMIFDASDHFTTDPETYQSLPEEKKVMITITHFDLFYNIVEKMTTDQHDSLYKCYNKFDNATYVVEIVLDSARG